ncbi:MAG: hypothetical protein OEO17_08725 [Gemmatimonadota bacterium]|nr:hypothetical protein [Gemmatimonadota bacterium]
MATKALDTMTDTDGVLITAHTPDKGFGTPWVTVGGVFDGIYSNVLRAAQNSFAVWDLYCTADVVFDNFEYFADVTRPNDGTTSAHAGLNFRHNGIQKSSSTNALSFVWERNTGDPDTVNLIIREWLGVGISNQVFQTAYPWARAVGKRMGVLVSGQSITPYLEDLGGGNRVTFAPVTAVNDFNDASHQRFGLWCQVSSVDNQYFDNLTVKDWAPGGGTPIPTMFLGRRYTSADVWRFGVGESDGAGPEGSPVGDTITFLAKSDRFAPAGAGGEAIFTQFWIALTYDMTVTLRFTPIVDGIVYDGTGTNPDLRQTLALTGTPGVRKTERYEFALYLPYDDGTDPDALRTDLRGTWFQLVIDNTTVLGAGDLIIEQPEIEFEIVRESEAAQ